jgi:hypothetical protein
VNLSGLSQGYLDYTNQASERAYKDALTKQYLQALQDAQQQKQKDSQANAFAGKAWKEAQENALGAPPPAQGGLPPPPGASPSSMAAFGPPPGQMPQPPMPGQSSQPAGPPQGPPQGMPPPQAPRQAFGPPQGQPGIPPPPGPGAAPGGPPPGQPAPPVPAATSPRWQPQPTAPPAGMQPQPGQSQLPPPPAAPPQQPQAPQPEPGKLMYQKIAQSLVKQGVPDDQVPNVMAKLKPMMDQQFNEELKNAEFNAKLQKEMREFAEKRIADYREDQKLKTADRRADQTDRKIDDQEKNADRRAAQLDKRLAQQGQGGDFGGKNGELMAALAERGVSLPAGFRSKQQQKAMMDGLWKRNPDLTADEIAEKVEKGQIDLTAQKAEGRKAGGIAGGVAYAENEIREIAPLVREASAKVPRDKFVPWNKLKQYTEAQLSDPDLKELHSYITTMSNAYDMLAARGGTDKDKRAESHKMLDSADSPEAFERAISVMEKEALAAGRAAAASIKSPGGDNKTAGPKKGAVEDGYRFKGGNPHDKANWEKV